MCVECDSVYVLYVCAYVVFLTCSELKIQNGENGYKK